MSNVPPPPPPSKRDLVALDTECYGNYYLVKFKRVSDRAVIGEFEMFDGQPLNIAGIVAILRQYTIVTFNGNNYDLPVLTAALMGYQCANLKYLSDQIIQGGMRPWEVERQFNLHVPDYIDHIDLIEVTPGKHSLKMYGGKMNSRKIQDLPIPPDAMITPEQRALMREYCGNDLELTIDLYLKFRKEIELREVMGAQYGLDLRSKSDAQIAEAVIAHELGFRVERPVWAMGTWFHYDIPPFIQYHTPLLQQLLDTVRDTRFVLGENSVEMPPELANANIRIGGSVYRLGIGGLHSSESSCYHVSDARYTLSDHDVTSYYPAIILNLGLYPPQMGPAFLQVFKSLVDRRVAAKRAGNKTEADSIKITINGTFGKTLSKYGILSAPKLGIQTTITGQLSLLMLIEMLEMCGIPVVSANTDGIVVKCPRGMEWLRNQVIADWERRTQFGTESTEYLALFSRDVNSYIAVKASDRSVKRKGAFAVTEPVGGSWPSPEGDVCIDAVIEYLLNAKPLEQTIQTCRDVKKFVVVRNVKGGSLYLHEPEIVAATRKADQVAQIEAAGFRRIDADTWAHTGTHNALPIKTKDAHKAALSILRQQQAVRKDYLGKVARWYYAAGSRGLIAYATNGNRVAKTEGCRPIMELPDELPGDIDYSWYVREAKQMLADMGVGVI